ncbi:MAG: WbuC family cupin fold metalloprotein [Candidatus Nanoarchaeia archaeon]|nr:WbuC family cupin fold metalloprotein [Candidatus Nanoarchaeia archaeon]
MEKVYSKIKPDILLHVINRKEDITFQRQDLSPAEEYLQVACFAMNKGKTSKPHKHIKQIRTTDITQESWLVLRGEVKIILYDFDDKIIHESILKSGDCLVTFRGGHEFIVLEEDTVIYEFKTGPYQGREKDNVSIDSEN